MDRSAAFKCFQKEHNYEGKVTCYAECIICQSDQL